MEQPPIKHTYTVFVDDNFHYMDESERYELGEFDSCESAVAACKRIVDEFLQGSLGSDELQNETLQDRLWKLYSMFGDDPFIRTTDPACKFSSWDYASRRCAELGSQEG